MWKTIFILVIFNNNQSFYRPQVCDIFETIAIMQHIDKFNN